MAMKVSGIFIKPIDLIYILKLINIFTMNRFFYLLIIISVSLLINSCKEEEILYLDLNQSIEVRVHDLLHRMTLEEKILQIQGIGGDPYISELLQDNPVDISKKTKRIRKHGIGWVHMQRGDVKKYVQFANTCQKRMLEESRLKIPVLVIAEALHGLMSDDGSVFPMPLALGATFDTTLIREVYSVAAMEGRARGTNIVLAPVLDVSRDPRWGRQQETYGEDPYLNGMIGRAAVLGFQGEGEMIAGNKVAVCLKHFVGHGVPESGNYAGPVQADDRTMHEIHLKPFHMVLDRVNAAAIMATYNPVNGIPICINHDLITNILKKQWGFGGIVFSDGGAIPQLLTIHHVARDSTEAALLAIKAGVDCELENNPCYKYLDKAYNNGILHDSTLNAAVARILWVKFRLGLFENPYVDIKEVENLTHTTKSGETNLKVAEESIILLKNEGDLLPINPEKYKSIGVIGPMADRWDFGSYTISKRKGISPLEAIKKLAGEKVKIHYARGCRIGKQDHIDFFAQKNKDVIVVSDVENEPLIREAVKTAEKSDVILLFLGEYDYFSGETWPDHFGDKVNLDLLGSQKKLLNALLRTGKPVITFQITSGARAYGELAQKVPSLVQCFYLGEHGGTAIAKVIFGQVNPSGKLPVTLPRSSGHIPVYYSKLPIARPGYLLDDVRPLFPFGHGLSYTTFEYKNLRLDMDTIPANGHTTFLVDIANTGTISGVETVQMYIRDLYASVTRPVKELKGFARVSLEPGETKTVRFTVGAEQLSFYKNGKFVIEPGDFEIMAGGSSVKTTKITLTVVGDN